MEVKKEKKQSLEQTYNGPASKLAKTLHYFCACARSSKLPPGISEVEIPGSILMGHIQKCHNGYQSNL